ncbi:MAG: hypothetical protein WCP32_11050 [Bacteroidota bacterium]
MKKLVLIKNPYLTLLFLGYLIAGYPQNNELSPRPSLGRAECRPEGAYRRFLWQRKFRLHVDYKDRASFIDI